MTDQIPSIQATVLDSIEPKPPAAQTAATPPVAVAALAVTVAPPVVAKTEPAPAPANVTVKMKSKPKAPKAQKTKTTKATPKPPVAKLDLGAGYVIGHRPGSGYSTIYSVLAKRCNFTEVSAMLADKTFNPKDPAQAQKLISKLFVSVNDLEEACRNDPSWKTHAKEKTAALKAAGAGGKKVLANDLRASKGSWIGHFKEFLSTCCRSYKAYVEGEEVNKNVKKFDEAGLFFRKWPLHPKRTETAYVMIYPKKFNAKVNQAIKAAKGQE